MFRSLSETSSSDGRDPYGPGLQAHVLVVHKHMVVAADRVLCERGQGEMSMR